MFEFVINEAKYYLNPYHNSSMWLDLSLSHFCFNCLWSLYFKIDVSNTCSPLLYEKSALLFFFVPFLSVWGVDFSCKMNAWLYWKSDSEPSNWGFRWPTLGDKSMLECMLQLFNGLGSLLTIINYSYIIFLPLLTAALIKS